LPFRMGVTSIGRAIGPSNRKGTDDTTSYQRNVHTSIDQGLSLLFASTYSLNSPFHRLSWFPLPKQDALMSCSKRANSRVNWAPNAVKIGAISAVSTYHVEGKLSTQIIEQMEVSVLFFLLTTSRYSSINT
jgi:hypothetical protein